MNIFNSIAAIIYPAKCISCGTLINIKNKYVLCDKCEKAFTAVCEGFFKCDKCGRIIEHNGKCKMCNMYDTGYDSGYCVLEYNDKVRRAIIKYKFKSAHRFSKYFGERMSNYIKDIDIEDYDFITCVPLHKLKKRIRGYNQSELLAKIISKNIGIEYIDALYKAVNTKQQSTLSANEREKNIKNAFRANLDINDKSILLVDDILTTGHTINECAKVLKRAGAKRVDFIVLACVNNEDINS